MKTLPFARLWLFAALLIVCVALLAWAAAAAAPAPALAAGSKVDATSAQLAAIQGGRALLQDNPPTVNFLPLTRK